MVKKLKRIWKQTAWSAIIIMPFVGLGICSMFDITGPAVAAIVAGFVFGGWCLMMTTAGGGGPEWDGIDTYFDD